MYRACARAGALVAAVLITTAAVLPHTAYTQEAERGGRSVDVASVRSVWSTLDALWNAGDAEQFSRLFTKDGSLGFVNRGPSLEGRAAIQQHFAEQFPRKAPNLRHQTHLRVTHAVAPDVIAVDGGVEILRDGPAGTTAPTILRTFVISAVMVRTVEGWRIRVLRAYQLPAATGGDVSR